MTTIDRPTREALHAGLVLDLSGLPDLWTLLDQNRADEARRLRERIEQDWRLLDDLGWSVADPRQRFELTMPPLQLADVVRRLHEQALTCLRATAQALSDCPAPARREADLEGWRHRLEAQVDEELDLRSACATVLKRLRVV